MGIGHYICRITEEIFNMNNKQKKKITIALVITAGVLIFAGILLSKDKASDKKAEAYAKIRIKVMKMQKQVGSNSILPRVYDGIEQFKSIGEDESKIEGRIKEITLRSEAIYWKAKGEGISLTNDEFKRRLNDFMKRVKDADEFKTLDEIFKKHGTNFEKIVSLDERNYRMNFIREKLYKMEEGRAKKNEFAFNGKEYDGWEKYWKAFEDEALKRFKKTADYRVVSRGLEHSFKYLENSETKEKLLKNGLKSDKLLKEIIQNTSVYEKLSYR